MSHRLTPRSRNPTGEMCPTLKSTLSMVVILHWTRLPMRSPYSSRNLSVLHGENSRRDALAEATWRYAADLNSLGEHNHGFTKKCFDAIATRGRGSRSLQCR